MSTEAPLAEQLPLLSLPTSELLQKFGSGSHKPGSGSAAALCGILSCKMLSTVCQLTLAKPKYAEIKAEVAHIKETVDTKVEPILKAAFQADAEAFHRVIEAREKRNAEEDPKRKTKLGEEALEELKAATEIPLQIADTCLKLAEYCFPLFDEGFQSARGDSGVAISSALAGASGAICVVYLNLRSYKSGKWATETRERCDALYDRYQRLNDELFKRVRSLQGTPEKIETIATQLPLDQQ